MSCFAGNLGVPFSISFTDLEKAKSVFLSADWCSTFWKIANEEEMVNDILLALYRYPPRFEPSRTAWVKTPEGFGAWVQQGPDRWIHESPEIGTIVADF